jgi:hypothetical protein
MSRGIPLRSSFWLLLIGFRGVTYCQIGIFIIFVCATQLVLPPFCKISIWWKILSWIGNWLKYQFNEKYYPELEIGAHLGLKTVVVVVVGNWFSNIIKKTTVLFPLFAFLLLNLFVSLLFPL